MALTFAVTYWDQLGWKDTFARPEFTNRQWDYAHGNQRQNVSTPQTIVNGRGFTNGGNLDQLIATIQTADRGNVGPAIIVQLRGSGRELKQSSCGCPAKSSTCQES